MYSRKELQGEALSSLQSSCLLYRARMPHAPGTRRLPAVCMAGALQGGCARVTRALGARSCGAHVPGPRRLHVCSPGLDKKQGFAGSSAGAHLLPAACRTRACARP